MPKARSKLVVLLPRYPEKAGGKQAIKPGMGWRLEVYKKIKEAAAEAEVGPYPADALIECQLRLALKASRLSIQDVDNLLKHVFDAMQGRLGGPKAKKRPWHLLPNDYQIRLVTVEKVVAPRRKYGSRLTISRYTRRRLPEGLTEPA